MDYFLKDTLLALAKETAESGDVNEALVDKSVRSLMAYYEFDRVRELLRERENTKETLRIAKTGIWSIIIPDDGEPGFYGDDNISDLIGVSAEVSPQERFRIHRQYIEPEDMDVFQEYSDNLINKGRAEVVYRYNHPTKGMTFARCGGAREWHYKGGICLRGYHQDITETMLLQKEQQKRLEEAMIMSRSANRAKSQFLSRMSHDIKTPINGIMGMTEIAKEQISDSRALVETLTKIETAGKHLLSLVNDVLDMSRLESEQIKITNDPFNLAKLLQEVEQIAEVTAKQNGIHLRVLGAERIKHPNLMGSPALLKRIFLNLISNGIRYNRPEGSVNVLVREIHNKDNKASFEIKVEDTGIGMDPEFIPHIFEAFSQENEGARTQYSGTGLGMCIVKQIVDQLGGNISVISTKNVGSSFNLTLTFEICNQQESQKEQMPEDIDSYSFEGKRVLIVEDNLMNLQITEFIAKQLGMESDCVVDGKAALDAFTQSNPGTYDVIFMDIMMPIMNGIEATKAIRLSEHPQARNIPIIAMTAKVLEEDEIISEDISMNGHVTKPININELKETLVRCRV